MGIKTTKFGKANEFKQIGRREGIGEPKLDGSGKGIRANKGRGGCKETRQQGKITFKL